jgi:ATP-dependent RNA helicase SUPV3L1/SUV3
MSHFPWRIRRSADALSVSEELLNRGSRWATYRQWDTFGVTEASPLDDGVAQAIMDHTFQPVKKLQ